MKPASTRTSTRCWSLAPAVMAFVVAVAGSTAPAQARDNDERGGDHREYRGRGGDERHYDERRHDRDYELHSYGRPDYVYAPPPVYYAPPPGPPVIDFVFPLRFR